MFTATVDASGFERHATAFRARLAPALREVATLMQLAWAEETRAAMKEAGIVSRTGRLADATKAGSAANITEITVDAQGLRLIAGFRGDILPYWRILDKGGTIVPRRAKMLAIPIHDEARALYEKTGGNGLRSLGDIFFVLRSKAGRLLLMLKDGARPMFNLVRSVTIRARAYVDPAAERYLERRAPQIGERFAATAADIWNAI